VTDGQALMSDGMNFEGVNKKPQNPHAVRSFLWINKEKNISYKPLYSLEIALELIDTTCLYQIKNIMIKKIKAPNV